MPDTTRAFLAIRDVQTLVDHWEKTQLGQLVKDPVMKPFIEDLKRQFEERWSDLHEKLGVTLDDLRGVAGGEMAFAAVQPAEGPPAVAVLVEVAGNRPKAQALLEKVSKHLVESGAKHQRLPIEGVSVDLFTLPPEEMDREPEPAKADSKQQSKGREPPQRYALYCLKDDLLIGSSQRGLIEGILARAAGKKGPCLAENAAFRVVMKRCGEDTGGSEPQIRWFVEPASYLEILRTLRAQRGPGRKGRNIAAFFKEQGFDAVQGLGGFVDFAVEPYEVFHRTAIYAPPPYRQSMKMFEFPGTTTNEHLQPQDWVPANIASFSTFQFDLLNAFDNVGPLVNALFGEGEGDAWNDILVGLKTDPHGPKIDLREDLMVHLGNRVTVLTDYQLPITPTSERLLFAVQTANEKAAAEGVARLYRHEKGVRQRMLNGYVVWESVPPPKEDHIPKIELLMPGEEKKHVAHRTSVQREQPLFPNAAITVARGHLMVASHYDFLAKVLKQIDARDTLGKSIEYELVQKALDQFGAQQPSARGFAKTDEQYRATYELIRQNKMPESETMLGRVLNTILGPGKKGVRRKQEIDGSRLPDYEFVRRHLGYAGFQVTSETSAAFKGWFIKGFILPKGKT
ncbi:MAG: hypothetical protein ACUVUC_08805 [Thermoguttaceae bacterium]